MEPTLGVLRLLQYASAAVLLGTPLLLARLPHGPSTETRHAGWPRGLLSAAALTLATSSLLGLIVQTAIMAGSPRAGVDLASLQAVAFGMDLGRATVARALCGVLALVLVVSSRRPSWSAMVGCGLIACASLAWMGHGAATQGVGGRVHLLSDILHASAAGAWMGALAGFLWMVAGAPLGCRLRALHRALADFSRVGTAAVATLVVTGLINSWFLVTPAGVLNLTGAPYGQLLLAKLGLFGLMILLATVNRFALTPRLGEALHRNAPTGLAFARLQWSLGLEAAIGLAVLSLVAWLGMLSPMSAG